MRKLNVRFFVLLLIVAGGLIGGLFVVHYFQQDRIAAAQLWQARNALEAGQIDKAAAHFERYLEFQPDDAVVMAEFADMLSQQLEKTPPGSRDPRKAIYLYEEVLKHDGGRDDIRRKLVTFYMLPRMRRYKDAETHLEVLHQNCPEDGSLWQQEAICQESTGQYDAAANALRKAAKFPPDQVRSYELLARILRKHLNRVEQSDETIAEMMERHGQTAEAHLARARLLIEFSSGDIAADAAEAIRLAPENAEAILLMARVHQQKRRVNDAIALLEKGIKLYPNDARMYRHLAWIEYFLKRNDSARERLQAGIINCPEAFELHTALAEILIQGKMFDQVQKIIAELKAKGVREDRISYLTSRIAVERGQWPEAVASLERLRLESRNNTELSIQINLLLAHCYRQMGDNDRQMQALQRVVDFDAHSLPARLGIAALYANTNRLDEAIQQYEQLINLPGAPESASVDMARLMIARIQRLPIEKQKWDEVERVITAIEKRYPNSAEIILARADLLAARNKTKEAADLVAAARSRSKDPRVWMQSAQFAELASGSGLEILDEAERKLGDSVDLRLKKAAILINRATPNARRKLRELEQPAPSFDDEKKAQLLTGLAELSFIVQDYSDSRRLFRQLTAMRPSDLHARVMLVEIGLRENDHDALPSLLGEVQKIEPPGGTLLPMLEARFQIALAEDGELSAADKAKSLLQTLAQKRPTWPLVYQGLGRIAEVEGDKAKAIEQYRHAIELGDGDLGTHHRLVRLLVEAKREREAEQLLAQVRDQGMLSPARQRYVLTAIAPMLKNSVVQQFVRQSIGSKTPEAADRVWVGKMLWDTGNRAKAMDEFRAAVAQAPQVAQNWVTLVQALGANRQIDEAKLVMEEARKRLPPEKAGPIIAQCLETQRDYDGAIAEYAKILADYAGDLTTFRRYVRLLVSVGKSSRAAEALNGLLEKPGTSTKEDLAWARRHLAILSTAERRPEQFDRAFELLKQNETEIGSNIEDTRAKVVLLSHQPPKSAGESSPRRRAIEILEKLLQNPQSSREDRFALAKLCDAEKAWDKADKNYRAVIAADPKNPAPLSYYIRRLLQQNKLAQASEPIRQLEKLAPDVVGTISLKARYQFLSGESERVVADLLAYANSGRNDTEKAVRCFTAASLLDEFVRSTANPHPETRMSMRETALDLYQRGISARQEGIVRMAALWAHTGHIDVAFKWLYDDRMKIPLNLRASALIAALRAGHADEAHCKQVETWLRDTAAKDPAVTIDLHLADLAELRDDLDGAIALYRKVLGREKGNLVAMNNLAWVLAHRGPSPEALELIQRAVALAGPVPDLLDTRAKVYLSLGRNSEAIQDLEDAITDSPTALRYFHLAIALENNANPGRARDAFQLAIQYGIDKRDLHPTDRPLFERMTKS